MGFDFFVDEDEDDEDIEEFIRVQLKKNGAPCQSVYIDGGHEVKKLWTEKMMKKCIKDYHVPARHRL